MLSHTIPSYILSVSCIHHNSPLRLPLPWFSPYVICRSLSVVDTLWVLPCPMTLWLLLTYGRPLVRLVYVSSGHHSFPLRGFLHGGFSTVVSPRWSRRGKYEVGQLWVSWSDIGWPFGLHVWELYHRVPTLPPSQLRVPHPASGTSPRPLRRPYYL